MGETIKAKDNKIEELTAEKMQLNEEMKTNKEEFSTAKSQLESQIESHLKQNKTLTNSLGQMTERMGEKEEKIQQLQMEEEKLRIEIVQEKSDANAALKALKLSSEKTSQSKQQEIEDLSAQYKSNQLVLETVKQQLQEANSRWETLVNRPREHKEVQTTLVGHEMQDVCVENPKLKEKVKELQAKLNEVETMVEGLMSENKQLLTDMDDMIKKAAKFTPDSNC
ncbi:hypothetical protein RFI_19231 [Reticulomyxa filosa]|uniref:Viral A-type inclusion protein n=1 Tax=Reticulomyxa filosa TaxID=46433 RepID=X6MX57_RETFI|nr:hypothetical protein RFI_19231 [Reticulomyxa filosa]|eukprot:ETO18062.1 hypothetical protein RFI_19231 [Reticulomyxa filosa]